VSCDPVRAIVHVRLAPAASRPAFELHLATIPAVRAAWHVTGDIDYELDLTCAGLAGLGRVLGGLRRWAGADVTSAGLVLSEIPCASPILARRVAS
jgi:hypothetical protein